MSEQKTIAIFGAGTGLGTSVAKRFGKAGYRLALVGRTPASLDKIVSELDAQGIPAKAFPADLSEIDKIAALVATIEADLGPIDTAVFAALGNAGFIPAAQLSAAAFKPMSQIFTLAPIELVHSLLPGMLARRTGAIVIADGLSAVVTMPGLSGLGPAMAATRNFIHTLHEELKPTGVYAGLLHIGAMISRSASANAALADASVDTSRFPIIDPDELAEEIWTLVNDRSRVEAILPRMPQH